jgi:ABC-type transport system substrate-binding protein
VKNDARKGTKQAFDRIELVPIGDENAAEIAFEAGELNFTYVPVSSIKRLRDSGTAGATLKEYPGLGYVWLGMNVDNEALKDIRVRQAVQYAINVNMVLKALSWEITVHRHLRFHSPTASVRSDAGQQREQHLFSTLSDFHRAGKVDGN